MAFIDIFNFKKYFAKSSDAQVARYGHVNALYDDLAPRIKNHGTYRSTASSTPSVIVPITSYAGKVDLPNFGVPVAIEVLGAPKSEPGRVEFALSADFITENSMAIVSVGIVTDLLLASSTCENGLITISILNYSTIEVEGITVNFLIIN
jgi:hypothetical protein